MSDNIDISGIIKETAFTNQNIYMTGYEQGRLAGLEEGIRLYAWWKNGVQYVGTSDKKLNEALEDLRAGKYTSNL